jgi:hypothetical protein
MNIHPRIILILFAVALNSCNVQSPFPQKVNVDDPQLLPFVEALSRVDRASMGFSSQPISGDILIERCASGGAYDVMLHIANTPTVSRTIAFRKVGDKYNWINEQEQHIGPKKIKDADGFPCSEKLFIIYQTEPLTGVAVNQTVIDYTGEDSRLKTPKPLTLDYVRPILSEWSTN